MTGVRRNFADKTDRTDKTQKRTGFVGSVGFVIGLVTREPGGSSD